MKAQPQTVLVRAAGAADAAACAAVYAPYVRDTAISFEDEPPSPEQLAARIAAAHAWLVAERDDRVVGFAYGAPHRDRAAYRWAADVSVYLAADARGAGIGRMLYEELFSRLRELGICVVCAGITEPNEASIGLHRALGFASVGTYERIGFKLGRWHDVHWMQLGLRAGDPDAPPPGS